MPALICVCERSVSLCIDFAACPYFALIFSSIKLLHSHTSDKKCMLATRQICVYHVDCQNLYELSIYSFFLKIKIRAK